MKNKIQKGWDSLYNEAIEIWRAYRFECIMAMLGVGLMSAIFRYVDGITLTAWSVTFWDAVFSGQIKNFAALVAENARGAWHPGYGNYSVLMMLPLAIWNLPIWMTHPLKRNAWVATSACILWSKMFFVICAFASGLVCGKIVKKVSKDEKMGWLAAVLFWSSGTVAISVSYSMQDEIVYIFTLLCAVYCMISEKYVCSLAFMMATVTLMPAMLLPCMLLLIYHSDRLIILIKNVLLILIPSAFEYIYFSGIFTGESSSDAIDWFFGRSVFSVGNYTISLFGISVLIIFLTNYFHQYEHEEKKNQFLFHSLTCLMTVMYTFSWLHFYRHFICLPFLIISILIMKDEQKKRAGLTVLCVFEYSRFFIACLDENCFNSFALAGKVKAFLENSADSRLSFYRLITKYFPFIERKELLIGAVAGGCTIWLLWLTWPKNTQKIKCSFILRVVTGLYSVAPFLCTLLFCGMLWQIDITSVSIEHDDTLTQGLTGSNCLEQYYKTSDSAHKATITIRPVTWRKTYPMDELLCVDIVDAESGTIIGEKKISANRFQDNQPYSISFDKIKILAGKWYIFRLYASEQIDNEDHYLFFMRSDDGTADRERHYAVVPAETDEMIQTDYDLLAEVVFI